MTRQFHPLHWQPQPPLSLVNEFQFGRAWLTNTGSLTQLLLRVCQNGFAVRVQTQQWRIAELDERRCLRLPQRQQSLVREVRLMCAERVLVYARTVIPAATLNGAEKKLGQMGSRPLGEYLFSNPWMQRGAMEYIHLQPTHRQYPPMQQSVGALWGRRSQFYLHQRPLLVCEWFTPALLQQPCPKR